MMRSQVRELQAEGTTGIKLLLPNVGTSRECSRNREQASVAGAQDRRSVVRDEVRVKKELNT